MTRGIVLTAGSRRRKRQETRQASKPKQTRARARARERERESTEATVSYSFVHRRSTNQRASRDQDSCAKRWVVQFLKQKKVGPVPGGRRLCVVYLRSTGPTERRRDLFEDRDRCNSWCQLNEFTSPPSPKEHVPVREGKEKSQNFLG